MEQNRNILFVDDDEYVLEAMRRNLRKAFKVHVATSGEAGLEKIAKDGPFAVVVSDMKMPGMDGATFLKHVSKLAPETIRIMLTGGSDISTAMAAVNEGNIFRFVTKPADPRIMAKSMKAALDQYALQTAEKNLIEKTLNASVQVLVDMLSISNPMAFSQSMRVKDLVLQLAEHLELTDIWELELAAMLSQLGAVTVPLETLDKYMVGDELSHDEERMVADHPSVAAKLIASIPRLENVASIIKRQQLDAGEFEYTASLNTEDVVSCGAYILRAAIDFDMLMARGLDRNQSLMTLQTKENAYHPKVLIALTHVKVAERKDAMKLMRISELCNGMVLAEDVKSKAGVLIVTKGQRVTDTLRRCLENNCIRNNIPDQVRIVVANS